MIWYLVIRRGKRPAEPQRMLAAHLDWMRDQHEQGTVLISGPSSDPTMGLYVVRASSRSVAEAIAQDDPLARDDQATIEIIEWHVHQLLGIGPFDIEAVQRAEGGV
ncbi:YciI family protein [Streptomyces sp. RPT161]|uniref:YciI family protein n=1 Tax=Streptomyces sp. RPT161 TaxID=3015993 RepID=UPI0022B8D7A6|nr:YciI family protein [Streptomyces sp. RPT161]